MSSRSAKHIGERIRAAREKVGMSQAEFARQVGTSNATICSYEQGATVPRLGRMVKIAAVCGELPEGVAEAMGGLMPPAPPLPPPAIPEAEQELRATNLHPDAGLPGWEVVGLLWMKRAGTTIARVAHTCTPGEVQSWEWWTSQEDDMRGGTLKSGSAEYPRAAMHQAERALAAGASPSGGLA